MGFSPAGVNMLKSLEGFDPFPYNDIANNATIGYGTLLHKGPVTQEDRDRYPNGISEPDAAQNLLNHVALTVEPIIEKAVKVALSQCQYDALCSFIYNIGVAAFDNSTLLRKLNMGQYESIPGEMARWTRAGGEYSKGLALRRDKEIEMWNQC